MNSMSNKYALPLSYLCCAIGAGSLLYTWTGLQSRGTQHAQAKQESTLVLESASQIRTARRDGGTRLTAVSPEPTGLVQTALSDAGISASKLSSVTPEAASRISESDTLTRRTHIQLMSVTTEQITRFMFSIENQDWQSIISTIDLSRPASGENWNASITYQRQVPSASNSTSTTADRVAMP